MRAIAPSFGYGVDRIPPAGGAVVVANHLSAIDPALVGMFSSRTMYYMAKAELLEVPVAGELLRFVGTFGVKRGEGDRDALRVARWLVQEGHMVGMFMEGTRQKFGYPGPAQPGAAMIAIQEGVPVVPCGAEAFSWSFKNRRRCAAVWGEPIDLSGLPRNGRGYKEGSLIVEGAIVRLWRLAAEAVAADFPEELSDGSRRSTYVSGRDVQREVGLRPWPDEPWAAGPLGPVYPGA